MSYFPSMAEILAGRRALTHFKHDRFFVYSCRVATFKDLAIVDSDSEFEDEPVQVKRLSSRSVLILQKLNIKHSIFESSNPVQ